MYPDSLSMISALRTYSPPVEAPQQFLLLSWKLALQLFSESEIKSIL